MKASEWVGKVGDGERAVVRAAKVVGLEVGARIGRKAQEYVHADPSRPRAQFTP